MPNPRSSKARGTTFERVFADWLRSTGLFPYAERSPRWGSVDKGDLVNTGPFCFELKACKTIDLAGFLKEAEIETRNAKASFPVVAIKRRNKPVSEAYIVQSARDWVDMVLELSTRKDCACTSA